MTQADIHELRELYRTARIAGHETRYERLCYATREFLKAHPNTPQVYKTVDLETRVFG
jgi:hypothetical protein